MFKWLIVAIVGNFICYSFAAQEPACKPDDETCEFWLEIEEELTCMHGKDLVVPCQGKLVRYDVQNCTAAVAIDPSTLIQGDAYYKTPRYVIVANHSLPGPAIEVYHGQNIIVHIKNKLKSDGVTMHWHGLHQRGTPWMDGAAFVTQCPIMPGQSFTYKFRADPKGTFWYHSHLGAQRTNGLYGPFIVHEKPRANQVPIKEHIMMYDDWNHKWGSDISHLKMFKGIYDDRNKYIAPKLIDDSIFSLYEFHSGLVNGQGRYYDPATGQNNEAPLPVFKVAQGEQYRFRVINAGIQYPFRVSVDDHQITLVSSDGADIIPKDVESFIISPGERFDFLITADQAVANYWIRGVSLEDMNPERTANSILRYDGANPADPTSSRKTCTAAEKCMVFNCPYANYPEGFNIDCQTFDDAQADTSKTQTMPNNLGPPKEFFLNWAFPGTTWTPGSVNGRALAEPPTSALTQPELLDKECLPENCGEQKVCECNYNITVGPNKMITLVLTNIGIGSKKISHPVHLHGYYFWVLKMGRAKQNQVTAKFAGDNDDLDCRGYNFCNDATWSNPSWSNGNSIPGANYVDPPLKDTLIVPAGGYAVVRFVSDNPGLWIFHCHAELHSIHGMAMTILDSPELIPKAPKGFPKCGSFHNDGTDREAERGDGNSRSTGDDNSDTDDDGFFTKKEYFWIIVVILLVIIFLQFVLNFCLIMKSTGQRHTGESGAINKAYEG